MTIIIITTIVLKLLIKAESLSSIDLVIFCPIKQKKHLIFFIKLGLF